MKPIQFKIEEHTFFVDAAALAEPQFMVQSVPRPYKVMLSEQRPIDEIQARVDRNPKTLVLVDANVYQLHLSELNIPESRLFVAPATEEFKSLLNGAVPVMEWMGKHGITKTDELLVVGGGIIQDVGAFSACVLKRGIPWVLYPTTLLSMCDSCIGGKTGLNHGEFKNQMALFSAPKEVVINLEYLKTLAATEIVSGLGEVLKLHLTGGEFFLKRYEELTTQGVQNLPQQSLKELIWSSLMVKRAVVEEDEFELSLRRSMNYGHTVGHAIENLSNFAIPHGKAVAIGMAVINELAVQRQWLADDVNLRIKKSVHQILDPESIDHLRNLDLKKLQDALSRDKKNTGSFVNLVVVQALGQIQFFKVNNDRSFNSEIGDIVHALVEMR